MNIRVENAQIQGVSIRDIMGRQVYAGTYANVNETDINTDNLASGMYFTEIITNKGSITVRTVKE
jgi:hypothetical protein